MGNGEVQDPVTDLPLVNGQDDPVSTSGRIVHWDAEWHWDATYTQYPHQALGGHILALGLTEAHQIWDEYTFPIIDWAHQQGGIAGFAHMQYLDDGIPQDLDCCKPIEYPVEVALGTADFIEEDVRGSDSFIHAYYRLLNSGFRPGFAAGSDFPCDANVGALLTYVQVPGGELTYRGWVDGIAQGRTVISRNGHNEFLNFTVNNSATPGDEINLAAGGGSLPVTIVWTANQNLTGTIELVKNGTVVASVPKTAAPGAPATFSTTVNFTNSGWLAARRMDANGHQVHTAAVFVTVDGKPVRASQADALFYVQWMDNLLQKTSPGGEWNSFFPTKLSEAQARYQQAKAIFQGDRRRSGRQRYASHGGLGFPGKRRHRCEHRLGGYGDFQRADECGHHKRRHICSAGCCGHACSGRGLLHQRHQHGSAGSHGGACELSDLHGQCHKWHRRRDRCSRQPARGRLRLVLYYGCRRLIQLQPVEQQHHSDGSLRFGHRRGGTGGEVPEQRGRLHHRAALLQVIGQHRHPCRQPVVCRGQPACHRDLHQ